jgi:hypothetical protein
MGRWATSRRSEVDRYLDDGRRVTWDRDIRMRGGLSVLVNEMPGIGGREEGCTMRYGR